MLTLDTHMGTQYQTIILCFSVSALGPGWAGKGVVALTILLFGAGTNDQRLIFSTE